MAECAHATDGVDARDEAPHPGERLLTIEFRSPTAGLGVDGEAEAGVTVQRLAAGSERRDHGNLRRGELLRERVFLADRA
jgi:hypothetical protein